MKQSVRYLSVAGLAAVLSACGGDDSSATTGTVTMNLTDAPTDQFTGVDITFTGIVLKPKDGEAIEFDYDEPRTIDLLELQGGATAPLLEDQELEAGEYAWIRLKIDGDNSWVFEGDQQKSLFVPSGEQSGLKLVSGFTVAQGSHTDFTIDFDARKSIVDPQGNPGADYILKPALRLIDNLRAGSIAGTVDSTGIISIECENVSEYSGMVYVFEGTDAQTGDLGSENEPLMAVPVDDASEPGTYAFKAAFLEEGDYTVAYSCSADDNEVAEEDFAFVETRIDVRVEAGEVTTVNFGG